MPQTIDPSDLLFKRLQKMTCAFITLSKFCILFYFTYAKLEKLFDLHK